METITQLNSDLNQVSVKLTPSAVDRVRKFMNPEEGKLFRISVEGGGCSGFQYNFSFDKKRDPDLIIQINDIEVLLDKQSEEYLRGSTIDFIDDFQGTGFTVQNPNAKATCGCGVSFTV